MDKVKKILEGYVEWIAVALGGAFLLWMVYSYVVQPPVVVSVGSTTVTPGSIDTQIWDAQGKALQGQIQSQAVTPINVPSFSADVKSAINETPPDVARLTSGWTVGVMPAATEAATDSTAKIIIPNGPKVTRLPDVPPLTHLAVSQGHSNTTGGANGSPVAAAGMPGQPGMPTEESPAGMGAPPGTPGAAPQPVDRSWVTVGGVVPSQSGLEPAFAAAKVPTLGAIHTTTILRVILVRQEQDSSGNWGPETEIPPPDIDGLPPMPQITATNRQVAMDQANYRAYAEKAIQMVCRPPFYQVVQGDKWFAPGTPDPNQEALQLVADDFDPTKFVGNDFGDLTDDQIKAVKAYRQKQAAAAAAVKRQQQLQMQRSRVNSRPPMGGPGGPGGPGEFGNGFVVADPNRPTDASEFARDPLQRQQPPDAQPGQPVAAQGDLPQLGSFNPAAQPDFTVWAHDVTVKPGKTYRYKLVYVIRNPVYATSACDPASLAEQFSIRSVPSEWTAPVNVESDSNFFASGIDNHGTVIKFDVFKWQSGTWQMQSVKAGVGDAIGSATAGPTGANFATGWTLVDIRDTASSTDKTVLLASDNGTLERDVRTDRLNKKYRNLLKELNANKSQQLGNPDELSGTLAVPPPGDPGGPPPGNGVR